METLVLALGAAVAGLVQRISGFAFAVVAMSIWVRGVNPRLAAAMAVFGGCTGQVIAAIRARRPWQFGLLWLFVLGSEIGLALGNRLLALLNPARFEFVLGSLLVVGCSAMLATHKLPSVETGGRAADAAVGL